MNIVAGYVLYNPDRERFLQGFQIVKKQFDKIIILDNVGDCEKLIVDDNVIYITEHQNKGIAYGLNRIMECAKLYGYEWVVTFDQDTIVPENMASRFSGCNSFNNINFFNFNTQNVENMYYMFRGCELLKKENIITKDKKILDKF